MKDLQYEIGLLKRLSPYGLERMQRIYRWLLIRQRLNNLLKYSPGFNLLVTSVVLFAGTLAYCQAENKMSTNQELKKSTFQDVSLSTGLLSEFFKIRQEQSNLKKLIENNKR